MLYFVFLNTSIRRSARINVTARWAAIYVWGKIVGKAWFRVGEKNRIIMLKVQTFILHPYL